MRNLLLVVALISFFAWADIPKDAIHNALMWLRTLNPAWTGMPQDAVQVKLKRVTDGDTIVLRDGTRIRLWGIDTPERDQPFGRKSTRKLKSLLRNTDLYLDVKDTDRYGRKVAVLYNEDRENLNLLMVCGGYAWWYEQYARWASDYKKCQEQAQRQSVGLWQDENVMAPWDWRRRR